MERPAECANCQRPVCVHYKEMVGQEVICTQMCAECPVLERKLHGDFVASVGASQVTLACEECGTTLAEIESGTFLGCANCYAIFGEIVGEKLCKEYWIAPSCEGAIREKRDLHVGTTPGQSASLSSQNRLASLNEALNEAVSKENYEEAARLRDQIKQLVEEQPHE